ncbi:MAG: hypothetical protein ABW010_01945, partial [Methyloceanibacter sp.]
ADIAVATAKGEIKSTEPGEVAAPVSVAKSEIKSVKSSEAAAPVVSPEANRVLVPAAAKRKRAALSRGRGEAS